MTKRSKVVAATVYPHGYSVLFRQIDPETIRAEWSTGFRTTMPSDWLNGMLADSRQAGHSAHDYR